MPLLELPEVFHKVTNSILFSKSLHQMIVAPLLDELRSVEGL